MKKIIFILLLFYTGVAFGQNTINSDLVVTVQRSVDGKQYKVVSNKHVPYTSSTDFLTLIPNTRRHIGQIAFVADGNNKIDIWQFVGGIADSNFKRIYYNSYYVDSILNTKFNVLDTLNRWQPKGIYVDTLYAISDTTFRAEYSDGTVKDILIAGASRSNIINILNQLDSLQSDTTFLGLPLYRNTDPLSNNDTLNVYEFTSTTSGIVPLSGGGTSNFLRADGSWAAPPGGGGTGGISQLGTSPYGLIKVNDSTYKADSTLLLTKLGAAAIYYPSSNPAGYTTNTGTVTNVTASGPLSITGTSTLTPNVVADTSKSGGKLATYSDVQLKLNKADSTAGGYYPYSSNPRHYIDATSTDTLISINIDTLYIKGKFDIPLPSANLIVGNSANRGQARTITGDVSFTNTGVTTVSNQVRVVDSLAMLAPYLRGGSIAWPGTIYSTPTAGVVSSHNITYSPSLANQSAYTLFGRGSGTGVPSFLGSIDSNWIPTLHSEQYYNTKYGSGGTTYSAGLGLLLAGTTFKLDTSYGKKYFTYGLTVPNDSTVRADTLTMSTRAWRQKGVDSLAALIGATAVAGSNTYIQYNNSGAFGADSTFRYKGVGFLSNLIHKNYIGFLAKPIIPAAANGDTLVGIDIVPTFSNGAFTSVVHIGARIDGLTVGKGGGDVASNTAVGYRALMNNTSGASNTAFGSDAAFNNTATSNNTAIGYNAARLNASSQNVVIGSGALTTSNSGGNNVYIGYGSGKGGTGGQNVSVGSLTLPLNTTGSDNVAIGMQSLNSVVSGSNNVGIGTQSMIFTTGSRNIAIGGYRAGYNLGAGTDNIMIGYNNLGPGGNNNTVIGGNLTNLSGTLANNIILADGAGVQRINVASNGNVGMGTNEGVPTIAALDVDMTTGGVLIPRLSAAQKNALTLTSTPIRALTLTAGSGYTNGTYAITFSGGGGSGAAGTVTVAGLVYSSYSISNYGSGYTSAPTATISAGAGSGGAIAVSLHNLGGLQVYDTTARLISIHNKSQWGYLSAVNANVDSVAQTAALTLTTLTSDAANSTYDVSGYVNVTAVATDVIQLQVTYTDENSNSQTVSFSTLSTVSNSTYSPVTIRVKAATTITLKTNLTVGGGSITYDAGGYIRKNY